MVIIGKYFYISDMLTYLYGNLGMVLYCAVEVRNLKYLIDHTKKMPSTKPVFIKCEINVSELEDIINNLETNYKQKTEENSNKTNGMQLTKK